MGCIYKIGKQEFKTFSDAELWAKQHYDGNEKYGRKFFMSSANDIGNIVKSIKSAAPNRNGKRLTVTQLISKMSGTPTALSPENLLKGFISNQYGNLVHECIRENGGSLNARQ